MDPHSARQVLDLLPSAILVADGDGRITFVNRRASEVLGRPAESFLGAPAAGLFGADWDPAEDERRAVGLRVGERQVQLGFSVSTFEVDGAPCRAISFRDVSESVRVAQERDRLLQLAAVGDVMPTLLHEVRNPLAAIMATVELMIEEGPPDQRDALYAILSEARRIALQLDGVGGAGRSLASQRAHAIDHACREVCALLTSRAEKKRVSLRADIPDLPLLPLDASTVRALLFNLVTNSIHACRPGDTICVHVRLEGGGLEIAVIDTGEGMSARVHAACTDLFFTTKRTGSGIGLALCRQTVEEAKGELEIASVPAFGTSVTLRIPTVRPPAPPR